MSREELIAILRRHEQDLKAAGVEHLSLFGSVARGESPTNDVDIAVRLASAFSSGGLEYFGRLEQLETTLGSLLGCEVDVVEEPVRKPRFQREIDRDRAVAF